MLGAETEAINCCVTLQCVVSADPETCLPWSLVSSVMSDQEEQDHDTLVTTDTCLAPTQVSVSSVESADTADTVHNNEGGDNTSEHAEHEGKITRPSEHIVKDRETVASIAAMYDVTPSELVQTNKLGMSRMVFPGQVLRIPSPPPPAPPPPEPAPDVEIVEYQFIKLKVRHITSGRGVVSGSVLFTPNAVIFDPDPTDPLVEELEPEAFQIIAPMEFVVNAAIFYDFFPIGSTGNTVGREQPPSQIFTAPSQEQDKDESLATLQRQETSESNYSLCQEADARVEAAKDEAAETDKSEPDLTRIEPYYLRLTMGKPVDREVSRSTPIMAYGKQIMWPEYWFIVPTKQILNLYKFFTCWFPEIYGPFDLEEIHEMGMELVPEPEIDSLDEVLNIF